MRLWMKKILHQTIGCLSLHHGLVHTVSFFTWFHMLKTQQKWSMCFEITLDKGIIFHLQSMESDLFVHSGSCRFRINLFICAASSLRIKIEEFLLGIMLITSFMAWFKQMHFLQLCISECSKKEDPQFNYLPLWLISKKAAGNHDGRGGHRCVLHRTCDEFFPKKGSQK